MAFRTELRNMELLLRNCIAQEHLADVDVRVLEITLLEARELEGVDPELLAHAQEVLEEARKYTETLACEEPPEVLIERLFDAINDGDVERVLTCLDANAGSLKQLPVDVTDLDGNTPLSEAACYGEAAIVEQLLARGAHPDARNDLGRTPLWRACYNGHVAAVELLLQHGAEKSIASNLFEEAGKHGTPQSKALVQNWDPAVTAEIRQRLGLKTWVKETCCGEAFAGSGATASSHRPSVAPATPHEPPAWPMRIGLRQLHSALTTAHAWGKVPLVVCNGLDHPGRFLLYSCEAVIDSMQLLNEHYFQKIKTLDEVRAELKGTLLAAMETHGIGFGLHVRLGSSACDFKGTFCCPGSFPAEVFAGPTIWTTDEVRRHFPDPTVVVQPEFRLVLSTDFSLEEALEHLASQLPYFEDMALIAVEPESLLGASRVSVTKIK